MVDRNEILDRRLVGDGAVDDLNDMEGQVDTAVGGASEDLRQLRDFDILNG